jgi:hypothetical protein
LEPGVVEYACSPSTGEAEVGECEFESNLGYIASVSKERKKGGREEGRNKR